MITGELKSKIDRVWDAFWSGGISNPLEVIEQITYLLFIRRLDDLQTIAEKKALLTGRIESPVYLPGQNDLRWREFSNLAPDVMYRVVSEEVFPFLRRLGDQFGGDGSTYSDHMKDARFTIPTAALLSRVVDMLDEIPMEKRDTNGDLYEYLLSKIASAGVNGQFRTPRHIISLMVDLMAPQPRDEICDPACGTAGFLVAASEYIREHHPSALTDATQRAHFHRSMFHGYDFDSTMLRIGSMNMLLHGIEAPDIRYRDSLSEGASGDAGAYSLVLANPPFAGSLDYESVAKDLQRTVKTKKTELLFLALFLKLLKPGGRAAVIVPDGVLFGSSNAHKSLRKMLVEEQKLDAVVKLPLRRLPPVRRRLHRHPHLHPHRLRRHRRRLVLRRTRRRLLPRRQAQSHRRQRSRRCTQSVVRPHDHRARPRSHRAVLLRPQVRHRRAELRPLPSIATARSSTTTQSTVPRWRSSPKLKLWKPRSRAACQT